MALGGSDFDALARAQEMEAAFHFHGELAIEDVEELPSLQVSMALLPCAGRHSLFDYAERIMTNQMPAVASVAPDVVLGRLSAGGLAHSGMFPCFFGGFRSRLPSSISSAEISFLRVSRGRITAST